MRPLLLPTLLLATACSDAGASIEPVQCGAGPSDTAGDSAMAAADDAMNLPEKRCGESAENPLGFHSADDIAALAGCTTIVGRIQLDSVDTLEDFTGLESVRRIEGTLNVFRSPGFRTLCGLQNLETIDGDLFIHLNDNLTSIAGLASLRGVTGDVFVKGNRQLPQSEVDALFARVSVGGTKVWIPSF